MYNFETCSHNVALTVCNYFMYFFIAFHIRMHDMQFKDR